MAHETDDAKRYTRRRTLAATGGMLAVGLAGCSGLGGGENEAAAVTRTAATVETRTVEAASGENENGGGGENENGGGGNDEDNGGD